MSNIHQLLKKKTHCKQKSRTRWLCWRILLNIQRRTYTKPSQILPKDWRGGNIPKVILWSHHDPDSKTRQDQIRSVAQLCPTLCDPMNRSTPGLPVLHQLPEFTQTHVQWVSDAIQPSHPLLSPSPLAPSPSQHQSLFQWVNSSHEVAKVLEFQL